MIKGNSKKWDIKQTESVRGNVDITDLVENFKDDVTTKIKEISVEQNQAEDINATVRKSDEFIELSTLLDVVNKTLNKEHFNKLNPVVQNFIDYVDRYNASSDIGTLSYLDIFAKSNTVNRICQTSDEKNTKYSNFHGTTESNNG